LLTLEFSVFVQVDFSRMKLVLLLALVASASAACTGCNGRVGADGTCTSATVDLTCTAGADPVAAQDGTATVKWIDPTTALLGKVLNNNASARVCIPCDSNTKTCTAGTAGNDATSDTTSTACHPGYFVDSGDCTVCGGSRGALTCSSAAVDLTCPAGVAAAPASETSPAKTFVLGKVLNNNSSAKVCIACKSNTTACTAGTPGNDATSNTTSTACDRGYFVDSGACTQCYKAAAVVVSDSSGITAATKTWIASAAGGWRAAGYFVGTKFTVTHQGSGNCGAIAGDSSGVVFTVATINAAGTNITTVEAPAADEATGSHCTLSQVGPIATTCTSATVDLQAGCPAGRDAAAQTATALAVTARIGTVLNNHAQAKCIQCKPNTKTCTAGTSSNDAWSSTTSTVCHKGYFVDSGSCTACYATGGNVLALTCSSATVDLTCVAGVDPVGATDTTNEVTAVVGHVLNNASARKCIPCKANTKTCTAGTTGNDATSNTTSTECHPGYYISSNACVACTVAATTCGANAAAKLAAGLRDKTDVEACPLGTETAIPATIATACTECATGAAVCSSNGVASSCRSGFTSADGTCNSNQFGTPGTAFKVCTAIPATSPAGVAAPGIVATLLAAVAVALRM